MLEFCLEYLQWSREPQRALALLRYAGLLSDDALEEVLEVVFNRCKRIGEQKRRSSVRLSKSIFRVFKVFRDHGVLQVLLERQMWHPLVSTLRKLTDLQARYGNEDWFCDTSVDATPVLLGVHTLAPTLWPFVIDACVKYINVALAPLPGSEAYVDVMHQCLKNVEGANPPEGILESVQEVLDDALEATPRDYLDGCAKEYNERGDDAVTRTFRKLVTHSFKSVLETIPPVDVPNVIVLLPPCLLPWGFRVIFEWFNNEPDDATAHRIALSIVEIFHGALTFDSLFELDQVPAVQICLNHLARMGTGWTGRVDITPAIRGLAQLTDDRAAYGLAAAIKEFVSTSRTKYKEELGVCHEALRPRGFGGLWGNVMHTLSLAERL